MNNKPYTLTKKDSDISNVYYTIEQLWKTVNSLKKTVSYLSSLIDMPYKTSDILKYIKNAERLTSTPITYAHTPYRVSPKEEMIFCNALAGDITVTLPDVTTEMVGKIYAIKKVDSSVNTVTITNTIDGDSTYVLSAEKETVVLFCTINGWYTYSFFKSI